MWRPARTNSLEISELQQSRMEVELLSPGGGAQERDEEAAAHSRAEVGPAVGPTELDP